MEGDRPLDGRGPCRLPALPLIRLGLGNIDGRFDMEVPLAIPVNPVIANSLK